MLLQDFSIRVVIIYLTVFLAAIRLFPSSTAFHQNQRRARSRPEIYYYLGSVLESFQDRQLCGLFESTRLVAGMWVHPISVAKSLLM